jgi:histidine triad (HIT) family protein
MENCVFCKIIKKDLPSAIFFEDSEFLAFTPLEQVSKGHILLIPKRHYVDLFDFEPVSFERLAGVAQKLSKELAKVHGATAVNLLNASGKDAQQSVFHFHLHIVPRYEDDGLDLWIKNKL